MFFWIVSYINTYYRFVLIAAASIWYFDRKGERFSSPISTGFSWGRNLHFGTLAIGSLILAILWPFQLLVSFASRMVNSGGGGNMCLTILQIIVGLFEKIFMFMNKHAYVETVLNSTGFFWSSFKAMSIISQNAIRFGALAGIVGLAMIFGDLLIAAAVTIVCHFLLQHTNFGGMYTFETHYPLLVILSSLIALDCVFAKLGPCFDIKWSSRDIC